MQHISPPISQQVLSALLDMLIQASKKRPTHNTTETTLKLDVEEIYYSQFRLDVKMDKIQKKGITKRRVVNTRMNSYMGSFDLPKPFHLSTPESMAKATQNK